MEAFNHVRNKQSFAHDNNILKYTEAMLIFGHVTSSIRFIEESENSQKNQFKLNIQNGKVYRSNYQKV